MALLTEKAILTTFEEMLEEMQFDRITVSALVKRCGVSSNTFYYHYQDIYALLEAWLFAKLGAVLNQEGEDSDWKEDSKKLLHFCKEHPRLIYHIFDSLSREQLMRYVFSSSEDTFSRQVKRMTADSDLSEEHIDQITQFCKYAYMGFFIRFLWNKMEGDTDKDVDRLSSMFENFIQSEISRKG